MSTIDSPSRSGTRSSPATALPFLGGRVRRATAHLLLLAVVGAALVFVQVSTDDTAEAFVAPPVPVIPVPAAGSVTLGGSASTTGVAAAAGGSGAAILAVPAVAVAGFAAGYYGMKGLCYGLAIYEGICPDYVPNTTPSVGAVTSSRFGCNHTSYYGQLIIGECVQYSWQTLADLGVGNGSAIPQAAFYYDKAGEPIGLPVGGCVGLPGSLPVGYQYLRAYHWSGSLACGQPDSTSLTSPPYSGGYVRARVANIGVQDGQRNGTLEPGDRVRIHHCLPTANYIGSGYPTPYDYGYDCNPSPVAEVPADPTVDARGREFRYIVTAQCWYGSGGVSSTNTRTSVGLWGFQNMPPVVPSSPCLPGEVATGLNVDWQVYKRYSYYSGPAKLSALNLERVNIIQWQAPAEVTTDANIRECYTVGATPCVVEQLDPADPETCQWGGQSVPAAYCGQTAVQLVDNPTGTTQPTPTTLPQGTTTIPGTPTTTLPPPPPGEPPPPPSPPAPDDFEFAGCVSDYASQGTDGVNWNPITWVRAILYYLAGPILCALFWAFVPPGGWQAAINGLKEPIQDNPSVSPLRELWQSTTAGGCLPLSFTTPGQGVTRSIDVGMCGNPVLAGLWILLIGFGVIGLGSTIVSSVSAYRKREPVYTQGTLF